VNDPADLTGSGAPAPAAGPAVGGPGDPEALPGPLPEPVRRAVLAVAADVLGGLPAEEVPPPLARVRTFAPAKRATSGAGPLAAALEQVPAFRLRTAGAWRLRHPELDDALRAGRVPPAADPLDVLAGLYLIRPPGWQELDRTVRDALRDGEGRHRAAAARGPQDDGAPQLQAALGELGVRLAEAERELEVQREALVVTRKELRRARADADRARAAAREAGEREQELAARLEVAERARAADERAAHAALAEVRAELETARLSVRQGRTLAESRVRLLLDTVVEAAGGLRRELALPPEQPAPADLLGDQLGARPGEDRPVVPPRAQQQDDPSRLRTLLSLPRAHLVVDGYNVTKAAYPSMTLADQRRRLVEGLSGLAARTGAEVTCCFDGAVTEGRTAARLRGVRVLFSDPGVTADEVIRRLVRAEPEGRVLIVASSDGEIVSAVRASGAHTVGAAALANLLTPRLGGS
jgi:predicted RNA-binding protein with PIN domain